MFGPNERIGGPCPRCGLHIRDCRCNKMGIPEHLREVMYTKEGLLDSQITRLQKKIKELEKRIEKLEKGEG